MIGSKKVNAIGTGGKACRYKESDFKEKAKYLNREMVDFQPRYMGLIKTIRTRGKGIKIRTTTEKGIGTRVENAMATVLGNITTRIRMAFMFHQRIKMLSLEF